MLKKSMLFLLSAGLMTVAAASTAPQISNEPNVNTVAPEQWGVFAPENAKVKLYSAYDKDYLYLSFDVAQTDEPEAGRGRGVVFYNDCIEAHIYREGSCGFLRVFVDPGNMLHIMEGGWQSTPAGKIALHSKIYPGKGYRCFVKVPWDRINPAARCPRDVRIKFTHVKVTSPLRYIRKDYEEVINMSSDKLITAANAPAGEKMFSRVVNFGRPGFNSRELNDLAPYFLDYKPELAIIMIGSNDVVWRKKWQTPEQYIVYVRKLCETLRKNNCKIILVTIPPCIEEDVAAREKCNAQEIKELSVKINKINQYLRELGKEFNIPVADYNLKFAGDIRSKESLLRNLANCNSADGVHPSADGYRVLALLLKEIIDQYDLPTGRVACLGDSITYGSAMKGQGGAEYDTYPGQLLKLLEADKK
ncbi:MAG: hypothetical protein E7047_07930 [Lentisphaerae bacterium]|nr:hypothetical protein [Lentisphaerota bacterium]